MRLTAIVPATHHPDTLARCRAAIGAADQPPEELLVVTQPPGDGPAAARNNAGRLASGDVLVYIDADVVVREDAFARIRAAFAADERLAAVFGSYDADPADPGLVSSFRNLLHHHVHQRSAGAAETFWAGLGALRRDVFLASGGFDSSRFPGPSIEDVELGMRLVDAGERVELDPKLVGKHLKRWTLREMVRTDLLDRGVPWVCLLLRRRRIPSTLNLGWVHRASAGAVGFALVAAVARRWSLVAASASLLAAGNASFYRLLWRVRGPRQALAGVALHALHHACALAALPLGACAYVLERAGVYTPASPAREERKAPELPVWR